MLARSCSLEPMGTAWLGVRASPERDVTSRYRATSYSRRSGLSFTMPDTRPGEGLATVCTNRYRGRLTDRQVDKRALDGSRVNIKVFIKQSKKRGTHNAPAKLATRFSVTVGAVGLHMTSTSLSLASMTPSNCGNHTRTVANPCRRAIQLRWTHAWLPVSIN